jgi:hypothetical protein
MILNESAGIGKDPDGVDLIRAPRLAAALGIGSSKLLDSLLYG